MVKFKGDEIEVISLYIYGVGSLGRFELKNHKNRIKTKKVVKYFEHCIVL